MEGTGYLGDISERVVTKSNVYGCGVAVIGVAREGEEAAEDRALFAELEDKDLAADREEQRQEKTKAQEEVQRLATLSAKRQKVVADFSHSLIPVVPPRPEEKVLSGQFVSMSEFLRDNMVRLNGGRGKRGEAETLQRNCLAA